MAEAFAKINPTDPLRLAKINPTDPLGLAKIFSWITPPRVDLMLPCKLGAGM